MIPIAQTSHEGPTAFTSFLNASGGRYNKDPGLSVSVKTPSYTPAIPKSTILICLDPLFAIRIFSSFRSLWIRPISLWQ